MINIRRLSQFQHTFDFQRPEDHFHAIKAAFEASDLGAIYLAIPWNTIVNGFNLKEYKKGPQTIFSKKGKVALMFLKHHACCSDKRLIEQLNANVHYQLFCDILLAPGEQIKNYKIVSQIRCELASSLKINATQKVLADFWKPFMNDLSSATTDATCYESEVRFPTNQKLLWESVQWTYAQMKLMCKILKVKLPRTKYNKWSIRYHSYSRKRRKPSSEKKVLTRSLLWLLEKLIEEVEILEKVNGCTMPKKYYDRLKTIKKVYIQQYQLFYTGENPKHRIVSIVKSYIRPIVRGKEIKKVEFGAKVNKIQIDGINFIEHIDFEAFNEGTHFKSSVRLCEMLTGTKLQIMGADAIYATNDNRKYATKRVIRTDFVRKGRAGKHEHHRLQLASQIKKERASRLEGSFGKEKEHYHLKRIKARTKETEILWIFFGIHTANALEIGRRMTVEEVKSA
jgi:hypothetical protein